MKLTDRLPHTEFSGEPLRTHRTGGEHALKSSGYVHQLNILRSNTLRDWDGDPPSDIGTEQFYDMLIDGNQQVMVAWFNNIGIIAGGIAAIKDSRITVSELAVDQRARRRGIAAYMLGDTASALFLGRGATEMVFDASHYQMPGWFFGKLRQAGFKRESEDGSPLMWLPGRRFLPLQDIDWGNPEQVAELHEAMPENWSGVIDVQEEADPRAEIFRDGELVTVVRKTSKIKWDETQQACVANYQASVPNKDINIAIRQVTEQQAIYQALNR